eukprot:CAMPEP_0184671692 /NCGR_PEP_ID=MMETSP0308-20130426/85652_1 /TAXON_ID=38269 /ORGANISM="Gloeochaete witrockiana, Strain SAG 46.84" /LENGTH=339 /DNA_ID=CAMNT_0027118867 /DNA_START=164 /DNA_END=1183 /DNA_ORIENTATION=+
MENDDRSQILIYKGEGVFPLLTDRLLHQLQENISPRHHIIFEITAEGIIRGDWKDKTCLLIFPGGRSLPYHKALQGEGTRQIRTFIEQGGRYLGICAGAYFASRRIEFDVGGPFEVTGDRTLCLFPGIARGPAYGPGTFAYGSEKFAKASPIHIIHPLSTDADGETVRVYFNGGCIFENADSFKDCTVLGRYMDIDPTPLAGVERIDIVQCTEQQAPVFPSATLTTDPSMQYDDRETREVPGHENGHHVTGHHHVTSHHVANSGPAAMVVCRIGKGLAFLSGVHFEADPDTIEANLEETEALRAALKEADQGRKALFLNVLREMDIHVLADEDSEAVLG